MIWLPGLLENMSLLQVSVQPAFSFSVLWPAGWVTAGSHVKGFMLSLRTLAQMRWGQAEKSPHSYPSTVSYKAKEMCLRGGGDREAPGMHFSSLWTPHPPITDHLKQILTHMTTKVASLIQAPDYCNQKCFVCFQGFIIRNSCSKTGGGWEISVFLTLSCKCESSR